LAAGTAVGALAVGLLESGGMFAEGEVDIGLSCDALPLGTPVNATSLPGVGASGFSAIVAGEVGGARDGLTAGGMGFAAGGGAAGFLVVVT